MILLYFQSRLLSEDYGKHLMGVDDLLQKHGLLESDIHVLGERVKTVNLQATKFVEGDFSDVGGTLLLKDTLSTLPNFQLVSFLLFAYWP